MQIILVKEDLQPTTTMSGNVLKLCRTALAKLRSIDVQKYTAPCSKTFVKNEISSVISDFLKASIMQSHNCAKYLRIWEMFD